MKEGFHHIALARLSSTQPSMISTIMDLGFVVDEDSHDESVRSNVLIPTENELSHLIPYETESITTTSSSASISLLDDEE